MSVVGSDSESPDMAPRPVRSPRRFSLFNVLIVALPIAVLVASVGGWYWLEANREVNRAAVLGPSLKYAVKTPEKLDARFADADNDMVADTPKDPKEWLDPPVLVFSTLGSSAKKDAEEWADFITHLKKATGKDVQLVEKSYLRREQFEEIAKGDVHILTMSTGAVPAAVNLGGFVPDCVMANAEGKWGYEMVIIVPKDSPINVLYDLRGKKMALANFTSHSAFKLPIVTLWERAGLLFDRDYAPSITGSQAESIQAVKSKRCDAAAVASDYLKRQEAAGKISTSDYKIIFSSNTYPPACFGHVNKLNPELAKKIHQAFLDFKWSGTSLEKAYKNADQVKFEPINYKTDWEGIRETERQLLKVAQEKP